MLITASAAIAASATTTAASAAPAAAAFGLRSGFVDGQAASFDLFSVQGSDGGLGFRVATHLDKAESLGSAGVSVHNHLCGLHGSMCRKNLLQRAVSNAVGQIAYVQLLAHGGPPQKMKWGLVAILDLAISLPETQTQKTLWANPFSDTCLIGAR
jgi:hypothetical protein